MKKILLCVLALVFSAIAVKLNGGSVLKDGKNYSFFYNSGRAVEVYKPSPAELSFGADLKDKIGESCEIELSSLGNFLTKLRAKKVSEEKGEDFFNLYYYSPLIRNSVSVGGKKVNLHVSFNLRKLSGGKSGDTEYVTVASPINYGGY